MDVSPKSRYLSPNIFANYSIIDSLNDNQGN